MITLNQLKNQLKKYNISTEQWNGSNKTVENLLQEINENDCKLVEKDGELYRSVKFIKVKVIYKNLTLIEDRQVFDNGSVRKRKFQGVSEKIKDNETIYHGAIRGLEEELNIQVDFNFLIYLENKEIIEDSKSYPGLLTEYDAHYFEYRLDDEQYREEYIEIQDAKKTYFKWVTI
jgi:hypothetical protein